MSPEPAIVPHHWIRHAGGAPPACRSGKGYASPMTKSAQSPLLAGRLGTLTEELSLYAPQWANRLARAKSEQELLAVVSALFNLTHALNPRMKRVAVHQPSLSTRMHQFIGANLHKGVTLKLLSQFLGYSEKYCSDLFHSTMGESFSAHLKRRRLETARIFLQTTDMGVAEIATAIGFGDQFAFSHFFKRATGQSPLRYRSERGRRALTPGPSQAKRPS